MDNSSWPLHKRIAGAPRKSYVEDTHLGRIGEFINKQVPSILVFWEIKELALLKLRHNTRV
jgi:hypothetical protein